MQGALAASRVSPWGLCRGGVNNCFRVSIRSCLGDAFCNE
ncbi:hypothetical protein FOWG_18210 [Fusarium oxysporum f. sp. lycopersici MN25]|nr:hypothetical protein FOWG_18210 [Fusarium oxysporum f. sp. lycopersici MN25]